MAPRSIYQAEMTSILSIFTRRAIALALSALLSSHVWSLPSVVPTGVTRYDPDKAYGTYVFFSGQDKKTHLIDMNGREVKQWGQDAQPPVLLDPALTKGERGHVLLQFNSAPAGDTAGSLAFQSIGELDWQGKVVWQWSGVKGQDAYGGQGVSTDATGRDEAARQHHDWHRLPNGHTALLVNLVRKAPAGFKADKLLDDGIYEVSPSGQVVWRWTALEHLEEFGFSEEALKLIRGGLTRNDKSQPFDYLHFNNMSVVGPNKWFDAGDQRFHPDNYVVCSREANFTAVIDRRSGKVVWHLGPDYPAGVPGEGRLPRPVDQIIGQHDAHIIPKGLSGAGNLLVFDNQGEAGYPRALVGTQPRSRVLEIDPVKKEIVWQYTAVSSDQPGWAFYSSFISSARRLPNGNTLIDEGMNGRFFQVTAKGEIVWEYVSPYVGQTRSGGGDRVVRSNAVYRAQPVPYDWVPQGTPLTEAAVVPVTQALPASVGEHSDASEVTLAFAGQGSIRNWQVVDDTHILIEDIRGQWYEATLQVPARELPFVDRIAFDSSPDGSFGRLSSVIVKGLRYPVVSLVKSAKPTDRAKAANEKQ